MSRIVSLVRIMKVSRMVVVIGVVCVLRKIEIVIRGRNFFIVLIVLIVWLKGVFSFCVLCRIGIRVFSVVELSVILIMIIFLFGVKKKLSLMFSRMFSS